MKKRTSKIFHEVSSSVVFAHRLLIQANKTHQLIICSPPERNVLLSLSWTVGAILLTAVMQLHTTMATSEHGITENLLPLACSSPLNFPIASLFLKTYLKERKKLAIHCVLRLYFLQFGWHPNTSSHGLFRMDQLQKVSSGQYWNETHPTTIEMWPGELSILEI